MRHRHWFQFVGSGILALFLGFIIYVTAVAYTRHSGSTGLDMATIQKIRYDALTEPSSFSLPPSAP
jgi:hypothetical protein